MINRHNRLVDVRLPDPCLGILSISLDAQGHVIEERFPSAMIAVGSWEPDEAFAAQDGVEVWIIDWLKHQGDVLTEGEAIAELTNQWERTEPVLSPASGILAEVLDDDEQRIVKPGTVIAIVERHLHTCSRSIE